MRLVFTIHGNQEKPHGNPIPYHRTTQKSVWNKASKRYNAWKQYVLASACINSPLVIPEGYYVVISVVITWANKAHGDGDNVLKGIADSLFINDKEVREGHFITIIGPDKRGSTDVCCEMFPEQESHVYAKRKTAKISTKNRGTIAFSRCTRPREI